MRHFLSIAFFTGDKIIISYRQSQKIFLISYLFWGVIFWELTFVTFLRPIAAQNIGDQITFKLERTYDYELKAQRQATLTYLSKNVFYFVADDQKSQVTLLDIQNLAQEFEAVIYPKFSEVFGLSENDFQEIFPLKVIFTKMPQNIAGYFDNNQIRNEIFLNSDNLKYFKNIRVYLAHEFQHLLTAYLKDKKYNIKDETWLNELRSEYVPSFLGYYDDYPNNLLAERVQDFIQNPYDSFYPWKNSRSNYGSVALFGNYFIDLIGKDVLKNMFKSDKIGLKLLDEIAQKNKRESSQKLFHNFALTAVLNNQTELEELSFKNKNLNFKIAPEIEIKNILEFEIVINAFDFTAIKIEPFNGGKILSLLADTTNDPIYASFVLENNNDSTFVFNTELIKPGQEKSFYLPSAQEIKKALLIISSAQEKNALEKIKVNFKEKNSSNFLINNIVLPVIKENTQPSLKISGSGFLNPQIIFSNGQEAIITSSSDKEIVFIFPPLPKGRYSIQIKNLDRQTITLPEMLTVIGDLPENIIAQTETGAKFLARQQLLVPVDKQNKLLYNKQIISLSSEELMFYKITNLVKAFGDSKIYEIDQNGARHWLKMSAKKFIQSGRKWEDVFELTQSELNSYPLSYPITK